MYQQPGYPPQQYYQQQPQRSAIPKVIGILMIIFGSLGLLGGLIGLAGGIGNDEFLRRVPELGTLKTVERLMSIVGLALASAQLYVGVRCIGYKANAPGLAKVYGITAIVIVILNLVISMVVIAPMMAKAMEAAGLPGMGGMLGGLTFVISLFGLAWPIVILALMTRSTARSACSAEL